MSKLINKKTLEFIRFVIVGVLATILHYAIYLGLEHGLNINYNFAYTIGYILLVYLPSIQPSNRYII